jgi:hypothetical protein
LPGRTLWCSLWTFRLRRRGAVARKVRFANLSRIAHLWRPLIT